MLLSCSVKGVEKTHCKGVVQAVKAVSTIVHDIETVDIMKALQRLKAVVLTHVSSNLTQSLQLDLAQSVPIYSVRSGPICPNLFIHSFISAISIALLQVLYYSEALPTTARILYRSFTPKRTGNCR